MTCKCTYDDKSRKWSYCSEAEALFLAYIHRSTKDNDMRYQNHFNHLRHTNDAQDIFGESAEAIEKREKPVDRDKLKQLKDKADARRKPGEQTTLF